MLLRSGGRREKEEKNNPYKSLQLISLLISMYKVRPAELGATSCGQMVYLL